MRYFLALVLLSVSLTVSPAQIKSLPKNIPNSGAIVFLGDSITFAGHFVSYLDGFFMTRAPEISVELINLGLPSETVSGLSEPDHPYPRPHLHGRLKNALDKTNPAMVLACYGMNDGIYYPPDAKRLSKYKDGVNRMIAEVVGQRQKPLFLLSPPPFDPVPIKKRLLDKSAKKFSWMRPYENYDDTLQQFTNLLRLTKFPGVICIDLHARIKHFVQQQRKRNKDFTLARDGIHLNPTGHFLIAELILRTFDYGKPVAVAHIDAARMKIINGDAQNLKRTESGLTFQWMTHIPMPRDPRWDFKIDEIQKGYNRLNKHTLKIENLAKGRYELREGKTKLGVYSDKQLAAGISMLSLKAFSANQRSAKIWPLLDKRQRLLSLAWLTDVGHKRPNTPKGIPLAKAKKQAAALERQIRQLVQPVPITLQLRLIKS